MGSVQSSRMRKEMEARANVQLRQEARRREKEVNTLMVEAGDAGGSVLLRQMKLVHHNGFSTDERREYRKIFFANIIDSMKATLQALPDLGLTLAINNDAHRVVILQPSNVEYEALPAEVVDAIYHLWLDPAVRAAVERSNEFSLNDSAAYYFSSILRAASPDYMPTDADILRCRIKYTGITETKFWQGDLTYKIFRMGEQKGERRKWATHFGDVKALFFVADISEYNEMLYEDESLTRLQSILQTFDVVCNSEPFMHTDIVLLLNHVDRFAEKLPELPLNDYFPDYRGGNDVDAARDYILHQFVQLNRHTSKRQIHIHYTCPTDKQLLQKILSSLGDIVLQLNLRDRKVL
ncbi:hypothetical protein CVT26_010757 [Gymnopilus dilepis]|uniref:Uncharacterized protein n=1 Tax=Gymnopilus dilepis TaxID=231916 RepID=A0A409W5B8_9AGAR|nr:hypothetical protein CVT26_010757 [Gymnopilus dilepis]